MSACEAVPVAVFRQRHDDVEVALATVGEDAALNAAASKRAQHRVSDPASLCSGSRVLRALSALPSALLFERMADLAEREVALLSIAADIAQVPLSAESAELVLAVLVLLPPPLARRVDVEATHAHATARQTHAITQRMVAQRGGRMQLEAETTALQAGRTEREREAKQERRVRNGQEMSTLSDRASGAVGGGRESTSSLFA